MTRREIYKIKRARKFLENIDIYTDVNPIAEAIFILAELIREQEKGKNEEGYSQK